MWKGRDATSANRWSVLDAAATLSSSFATAGIEDPGKLTVTQMVSDFEPQTSSNMTGQQESNLEEISDVADDWEKAYDLKGNGQGN